MNARQLVLGIGLVATAAATWWVSQDKEADTDVVPEPRTQRSRAADAAPASSGKTGTAPPTEARAADRYAALGVARAPWPDVAEELARGVNFAPPARSAPSGPPPAPTAPPLPYRFVGAIEDAQGKAVFLLDGNQVRLVREGEKLGSQYRVERITSTNIEMTYLPLGLKQTLSRQSP
ncbi:MAG TPA: hypothetical protein VJ673_14465 [Aromatoleum sp.]|uniref:hypothetical protein n=1 Tax=Aromatoleum sp. TaxID=2307007 RepID=UPI002B45CC17|nr:hypothetical protein [Aromatoleum sp.]HJV26888.1 hypothetical protein [Aromatoleum sp.]